jgi:hypothetical protein
MKTWARVREDYIEGDRLPIGALGKMRRVEDDLIKEAMLAERFEGESLDYQEEDEEGEYEPSLGEGNRQPEGADIWSLRHGDPADIVGAYPRITISGQAIRV